MKRKKGAATDLRAFLARAIKKRQAVARAAIKKRQAEVESVPQSCNESQMNEIFGYTTDLCNDLQKREQRYVNAMNLLEFTEVELDVLRQDSGWQEFLTKVTSFCEKHNVKVVDMNGKYIPIQRSKKLYKGVKNYHRFHADMFLGVIDRQVQELNNRFDEEMNQLPFHLQRYINDVKDDENFKI